MLPEVANASLFTVVEFDGTVALDVIRDAYVAITHHDVVRNHRHQVIGIDPPLVFALLHELMVARLKPVVANSRSVVGVGALNEAISLA